MSTLTDAHDITAEMLCAQAVLTRSTLERHIRTGLIEAGVLRPGTRKVFWTRTQANKWLRRIGQRDRQFE